MTRDAKVLSRKLEKERAQRILTAKKSLLETYGEVLRTLKTREDALLDEAEIKRKNAEDEVEHRRRLSEEEIQTEHEEKLRRLKLGTQGLLEPIRKRHGEIVGPIRKTFDGLRAALKEEYDRNFHEAEKDGKIDIERLRLWWENEVRSQGLEGVKFYWSPDPPKTQACSVCGKATQTLIQGIPFCSLDEWRERSGLGPQNYRAVRLPDNLEETSPK